MEGHEQHPTEAYEQQADDASHAAESSENALAAEQLELLAQDQEARRRAAIRIAGRLRVPSMSQAIRSIDPEMADKFARQDADLRRNRRASQSALSHDGTRY